MSGQQPEKTRERAPANSLTPQIWREAHNRLAACFSRSTERIRANELRNLHERGHIVSVWYVKDWVPPRE